jgi:hypothetical protein
MLHEALLLGLDRKVFGKLVFVHIGSEGILKSTVIIALRAQTPQ